MFGSRKHVTAITRTYRLAAFVASVALAGAMVLSACGGDASPEASQDPAVKLTSQAAKERVEKARAPVTEFEGPSVPPREVPADKEIAVIFPIRAPLPDRATAGVVEAAESVGWSTRTIDGEGHAEGYVNAIELAISADVDGIVLVAMPVPLLTQQIKKADAAGIPVVAALPSIRPDEDPGDYGLFDVVRQDVENEGVTLGSWVVVDAPDGTEAIRLDSPEFADLSIESELFEQTLEAAGPEYEVVEVIDSPVTDILGGPQGVQRLAAAMRSHPEVKYMFILSESWAQIFMQAKELTGRDDIVGLGANGDVSVPLVRQGEELVMISPDSLTFGWYAIDAMIRAFNDERPVHYHFRSQLVDAENADQVKGSGITAEYDYRSEWKELWGVSD